MHWRNGVGKLQCFSVSGLSLWLRILLLSVVMCGLAWDPDLVMPSNKLALRDKVLEMFHHAYSNYMNNAYPADELMPITCKGRIRGVALSRGDVDDSLGNFSLTLIDTLDTLAVLGLYDEFEDAVQKLESSVKFNANLVVSVFETNIRVLGGLLGGHSVALELQSRLNRMQWYNGFLLTMAKDVGDRLLPAFNTTTGIPMSRVNLASGAVRKIRNKDTCTACAGTMILEMAALSRLTGDPKYERKARKAMDYLWSRRQRSSNLMGTVLNVNSGEWIRKESGIGAGIDSYYEYLLKAYILYGDEEYLLRFNTHYSAIKQYIKQGPLLLDVLMHKPSAPARTFMDALTAFWPGLLVLKGDLVPAVENHELLYQVFQKHKFLPEAFTTTFDIYWGQNPLRPEFAESTYLLYKATKDPYYLEVGKAILENLEKHSRVKCGYAGIKNVQTLKLEDRMDSYFLAEMFKYLYLLFSPANGSAGIDVENYVFTTEAHLLPLYLTNIKVSDNETNMPFHSTLNGKNNMERHCENSVYVHSSNIKHLQKIRSNVKDFFHGKSPSATKSSSHMCGPNSASQILQSGMQFEGKRMLTANDFNMMNKDHLKLIKLMGITTQILEKGKIQLNFDPKDATSEENAAEGRIFLYEIQELNKQTQDQSVTPVFIQLLSPPYLGSIILQGASAQFGPDLSNNGSVTGALVYANPLDGCSPLLNIEEVTGKIVIAQRGECMFVTKTKNIERANGIAALIFDNKESSKYGNGPAFTMAGDGETETSIPSAFLFSKEASVLRQCMEEYKTKNHENLSIFLGNEAKVLDEVISQYGQTGSIKKQLVQEDDAPYTCENGKNDEVSSSEQSLSFNSYHLPSLDEERPDTQPDTSKTSRKTDKEATSSRPDDEL